MKQFWAVTNIFDRYLEKFYSKKIGFQIDANWTALIQSHYSLSSPIEDQIGLSKASTWKRESVDAIIQIYLSISVVLL